MHLSLPKNFPLLCFLASSVCTSLQCLISTLTQGGKCGHLFRLTCSVVLWGRRNTANKYHWLLWEVLTLYESHWACPSSHSGMYFPGLHCSGSGFRVLHKGTDLVVHFVPFQGQNSSGNQVLGERTVLGGLCILITSMVLAAQCPGYAARAPLRCAMCLLWGADL